MFCCWQRESQWWLGRIHPAVAASRYQTVHLKWQEMTQADDRRSARHEISTQHRTSVLTSYATIQHKHGIKSVGAKCTFPITAAAWWWLLLLLLLLSVHWFQRHLTFNSIAGALYTVSSVHWNPSYKLSEVDWERNILSWQRNISGDGEALIIGGRSFHALATAMGKARSPSDTFDWQSVTSY